MSGTIFTVANGVTAIRVVLLGVFVVIVLRGDKNMALLLFMLAWLLDGLDGFAARALHQETAIGSMFDKVVDRLLIIGGSVLMVGSGMLPPSAILLLTKDICLAPVLSIHASRSEKIAGVGSGGKIITILQGLGLIYLLLELPAPSVTIGIVAVLGFWVAFVHVKSVAYPMRAV